MLDHLRQMLQNAIINQPKMAEFGCSEEAQRVVDTLTQAVRECEAWEILRKQRWTLDLHNGLWAITDDVENWICQNGVRLTAADPVDAVHAAKKWITEAGESADSCTSPSPSPEDPKR